MSSTPIITLLTDFGTADGYVGAMKGVILGLNPRVKIVDITHDIPPQDIIGGALALSIAAPFYPKGTIHVAVVDPGVGSDRKPILMEWNDQYLIGPDNGLLTLAFSNFQPERVYHLMQGRIPFGTCERNVPRTGHFCSRCGAFKQRKDSPRPW